MLLVHYSHPMRFYSVTRFSALYQDTGTPVIRYRCRYPGYKYTGTPVSDIEVCPDCKPDQGLQFVKGNIFTNAYSTLIKVVSLDRQSALPHMT